VAGGPEPGFGDLLRRLRADAGLTQEQLAKSAGLSSRSVSDLERGVNRTARNDTARLLAGALGLAEPERALFVAAALGRAQEGALDGSPPGRPVPLLDWAAIATRTLPRDTASFTGRAAELERLMAALDEAQLGGVVGICAIGGMAGIGKTALAVHAGHQLAGGFPDGQIFLSLHGHTTGQRPVDPGGALASLLLTVGFPGSQIPATTEARAGRWRSFLANRKMLLILDDAADHEQIRPLLPGSAGSLVIVTSRRRLTALEDTVVISLDTLDPGDAADLLTRLAGRQDLSPADDAVAVLTRLCGCLPLAIGILAQQLRHHPSWTPADLAADLAAARDKLELMRAENLSVAAAFGLSYRDLSEGQQLLFGRLGTHPGPDFDAYAAAALCDTDLATAAGQLSALYDQHLITEPTAGRYRLHDLLREHAQGLASAADPVAQESAAGRLLDYYLHTALAAGRHFPAWYVNEHPAPPGHPPACAPPVSTHQQAAAWLAAEWANLTAVASHAGASGWPQHAVAIAGAMAGYLDTTGRWNLSAAQYQRTLAIARRVGDRPAEARVLILRSTALGMTGDIRGSVASAADALELYRDLGDQAGQGYALAALGFLSGIAEDFPAAVDAHQRALGLFEALGSRPGQILVLLDLSDIQKVTGAYPAAIDSLRQALALSLDAGHRPGEAAALTQLGVIDGLTGDYTAATSKLRQAIAINREHTDRFNLAQAGIQPELVQRCSGDYPAARASQQEALKELRNLDRQREQPYALDELGLLHQASGDYPAAAECHEQALALFRASGDRVGQTIVLNSLGELSGHTGAIGTARKHYGRALVIARDLGIPLEEARAMEGSGYCHLREGRPREGIACLRQALAIYQRLCAPEAVRVQEDLLTEGSPGRTARVKVRPRRVR